MKETPILFNAPMVRAILAGTKTQTRRIVKPHLIGESRHPPYGPVLWVHEDYSVPLDSPDALSACPIGQPGDRLWVRETFNGDPSRGIGYAYRATQPEMDGCPWMPSIHMPRAASRITLEVTGVRVERLNEISEEDAQAEGVEHDVGMVIGGWKDYRNGSFNCRWPSTSFRTLWESINGPGSTDANPWVWVVEFRRVES